MKVTLISYTPDAVNLLLFTKATRLTMSPDLLDEIRAWPEEKKMDELNYMANTVPSSWEFVDYVFMVQGVSRACTHQMVRTRVASYAQQAMRIVPMTAYDYVFTERNTQSSEAMDVINQTNKLIRENYARLIEMGQPVEDARGILPTNIATNIVCKYNLRAFGDLVRKRTGGRVQREYQMVAVAMLDEVLKVHPWAEKFLLLQPRNYFDELEAFAKREFPDDFFKRNEMLKIVDRMRKGE